MLKLAHHYPINSEYKMDYVTQYDCLCMAPTVLGEPLFISEAFGHCLNASGLWMNYAMLNICAERSSVVSFDFREHFRNYR